MDHRMFPPNGAAALGTTVNGRTYTCVADSYIDVPDFDAKMLTANGWMDVANRGVGATTARPTDALKKGDLFLDTTVGFVIFWDGLTWRDPVDGTTA